MNFEEDNSLVSTINYESGRKETYSETESLYKPHNQNDGTRQYNDVALLELYKSQNKLPSKVKKLRTIGWIGGGVLFVVGAATCGRLLDSIWGTEDDGGTATVGGIGLIVGGAAWTTTFLLLANHQNNKEMDFQSSNIYQYNFEFSNGSSLSLGADMLSDCKFGTNTVGLGLRYNF